MSGKPDDESAFLFELGRRVRRARRLLGLTRRELAGRSGVSERYLAQLEAGEGNISVLLMRRTARVLRTDLGQLLAEPTASAEPAEPADSTESTRSGSNPMAWTP